MQFDNSEYTVIQTKSLSVVNQTLYKTYLLLSATIFMSIITIMATINGYIPCVSPGIAFIGMLGLATLTQLLSQNKFWGLISIFTFTGFMGCVLAPFINFYLYTYSNGIELVLISILGTTIIFLSLAAYTVISKRNFNYLEGILYVSMTAIFLASLSNIFLGIEILSVIIASFFMVISSGLILLQISNIINEGERNYIIATISLYMSIFNIFVTLLRLIGYFAGNKKN